MTAVELHSGLQAHASGCLWRPESRTLFAADLHLGYAWAQRRRGELAPLVAGDVVERLLAAITELGPRELVLLGDITHAPRPAPAEWALIQESLYRLASTVEELVLVAGNHDRGLSRPSVDAWRDGALLAVHGHILPDAFTRASSVCLYGHWHPALTLRDAAGANHRLKAFLVSERAIVLPAQSSFAAGINLRRPWPDDLRAAMGEGGAQAWAMAGRRLKGPLRVDSVR